MLLNVFLNFYLNVFYIYGVDLAVGRHEVYGRGEKASDGRRVRETNDRWAVPMPARDCSQLTPHLDR